MTHAVPPQQWRMLDVQSHEGEQFIPLAVRASKVSVTGCRMCSLEQPTQVTVRDTPIRLLEPIPCIGCGHAWGHHDDPSGCLHCECRQCGAIR